jgi:hypothetical protein
MEHKSFFLPIQLAATLSIVLFSLMVFAYPSGAPAGYTGSPGDGQHCQSCHGGSNATVSGWITSNIPSAGYTGGVTYTITATVSGSGKKGFEISPQSTSGLQLGTLAAGTNNHLVGGTKYVTQNSAGSTSGTVVYNFSWIAPAAGTGTVTFYGAFTVGKTNTKLSTMVVNENAALPLTVTAVANPSTVCAGSQVQLEATATGGNGSYTYQWSSNPPGFSSSIYNPVVNPSVTTTYTCLVSDGSGSMSASAPVTVVQAATANAGNDTTCSVNVTLVPLHGIAQHFSAVEWTTSGTGTFSSAVLLNCNYLPSQADKTSGSVTLTLKALPMAPCATAAEDTKIVHFEIPSGMEPAGGLRLFTVCPNPSNGNFKLSFLTAGQYHITVSSITGREIYSYDQDASHISTMAVDLQGQAAGLYFVKVKDSQSVWVEKLMIR